MGVVVKMHGGVIVVGGIGLIVGAQSALSSETLNTQEPRL